MARLQSAMRLACYIFFALLCILPVAASAQSPLSTAAQLSNSALEDYDFLELESADAKIMQATHLLEENGITDPIAAQIYVVQGIVSFGRFKDSAPAIADERAFTAFVNALMIDGKCEIPSDYKSPELEEVFERAKATIQAAPKTSAAALSAVKPSLSHVAVSAINRCQPIEIKATVPAHPDIYRTYIYYAVDEQTDFTLRELHPTLASSDILTVEIPGADTRGDKIRYYLEAQSRTGEVVASVASPNAPITAVIAGDCSGLTQEDVDQIYGDPLFQLSVMVGAGFGIVEGELLNCYYDSNRKCNGGAGTSKIATVSTGMAVLPLHLRASGVFNLPHYVQLGFYVRGQLINIVSKNLSSGAKLKVDTPEIYNVMVGLTLRYLILHTQPYRLYIGAEVGWGGSNASVMLNDNNESFVDIYLYKGPFHIAPEMGFLWTFHKNVGLALELAIPIHFPDRPSVHFDVSVGPFFQF